jgi:hypothetical protein
MAKKYNKKKKSKYPGYMSFNKGLGLNPAYGEDGGKLYYQQDIGTLPPNFGRETFEFNKKQPLEFGKKPLKFAPARFIETPPTGLRKIEKDVNEYLGYPMRKAFEETEALAPEGEDPADNLRHGLAGMYTAEAIANKFPKVLQDYTPIPKAVGFLGSNILGVGHELSALQNRELEGLGTELMTSAEDLYNNFIGSGISALPFMTTQQKANLLREMSDKNLLPDGVYDVNGRNLYFKKSESDPGSFAGYKKEQGGWLDEFEEGGFMGKTTVEAGGAKHVVYTGKKGDIMVTHPEMDNGAWDTINLTEVSDAKSLAQGVDATLDWHRKHPYHKKKKAYGGKYRAPKYNDKRIGRGDDGGEVWLYQQDLGYLPKFLGTKTVGLQSGFSNALKNAVARNTEQQKEDTNKGYSTVLTNKNIVSREGSGPYLTNEVHSEGDAAAEFTSIPGLIRFAKNPIKALEGTLSSADRFIIGLSPFSKMTGTYSDFKPEELEGLSNTLDAAGVVSSLLPLAKTIPLPKGLQKVNRFLNKVEPLPKAQFPPDYNPNIPPTRSYDLNLLVEDWTDISNGLPARNYPDLPLERNEYFQDLILENQRKETQRRLNLRQQNPPGWEYLNSGTANKSKVNKSGLTKEEAIAKAAEKDKDKLSKMTETEFENTVVKPNGEIVEYTPAMDLNLQWNQEARKTLVPEAVPLSSKEFEDLFNSRLDLADEIIASRNKSGVEYKLKGLKNNQLTFYTPKQEIPVQLSPKQIENIELFNKDPKDFLVNKAGLQQTPDGKWTVMHVDEEFDSIDDVIKFVKEELDNEIKPKVIEGESTWDVDINPGLWEGQVQDIANVDYYKSIPGLDMKNTMSSVFADRLPRKGTGAYESINEFLKRLNLGRVKPGFNSQTDFSRGAWENFINSGRGVGFYGNPSTVYGSLKSALPYVGISGTGSWVLNNMKNRKQEYKQGGWLDEL